MEYVSLFIVGGGILLALVVLAQAFRPRSRMTWEDYSRNDTVRTDTLAARRVPAGKIKTVSDTKPFLHTGYAETGLSKGRERD
jgi:hypothetical protein